MWPTKWGSASLKDDKLDLGSGAGSGGGNGAGGPGGVAVSAANGGSPYSLPSFVGDHQGVFNGTVTSSSGDPLYDTISTMTQAQSTAIYTPPLGTTLGKSAWFFFFFFRPCSSLACPVFHFLMNRSWCILHVSCSKKTSVLFLQFFIDWTYSEAQYWCRVLCVFVCARVGSGSLTPLTPISMQEIKAHMLGPNGVVDTSLQYQQGKWASNLYRKLTAPWQLSLYIKSAHTYAILKCHARLNGSVFDITFLSWTLVLRWSVHFSFVHCFKHFPAPFIAHVCTRSPGSSTWEPDKSRGGGGESGDASSVAE